MAAAAAFTPNAIQIELYRDVHAQAVNAGELEAQIQALEPVCAWLMRYSEFLLAIAEVARTAYADGQGTTADMEAGLKHGVLYIYRNPVISLLWQTSCLQKRLGVEVALSEVERLAERLQEVACLDENL